MHEVGTQMDKLRPDLLQAKAEADGRPLPAALLIGTAPDIFLAAAASLSAQTRRPNVLLIMADDFGYECVAANGGESYRTPHLDRMAAEGTRFTEFHATSPVCSPSRCSVITGHYPARHLLHGHLARYDLNLKRHMPHWLDVKVHSLPRLLQQAGWRFVGARYAPGSVMGVIEGACG